MLIMNNKQKQSTSRLAKTGLVLLLTLMTTVFMHDGMFKPMPAAAAITQPAAWTVASTTANPAAANYTIAGTVGSSRMLVVGVSITSNSNTATPTCSVSYGGTALTAVPGTSTNATAGFQHTYLFYMQETGNTALFSGSTNSLAVTVTGGTTTYSSVYKAVFAGADQTATPFTSSTSTSNGAGAAATPAFATGLNIAAGDQAVEIINATRSASTTYRTITTWNLNWSAGSALAVQQGGATNGTSNYIGSNTTANASNTSLHTWSGTSQFSISGMSIKAADITGPTDGTLTVTPGISHNDLSWTAASDASGINHYDLYFSTVATPATCTGTVVPGSPFAATTFSVAHNSLVAGTQYFYRLCATDNSPAANQSAGVTGSGTPTKWPSTITSCNGCHGDNTTFNDGTARNTPAGQFQGSHQPHAVDSAYVCTTCHIAQTGNDHSRGSIQMAALISGGTYSKTSPITVTNTFTPGTCSGTTCHGNVYGAGSITSPSWGTVSGCGACHVAPYTLTGTGNAPPTGGHTIHMAAGTACGNCHAGTVANTSGGTRHANGFINTTGAGYNNNTDQIAKHAAGSGYKTCARASCHADPYSTNPPAATNTWGTAGAGCAPGCHKDAANNLNQGAFRAYSAPAAGNSATPQQNGPFTGSHTGHINYGKYVCADCHAGAVTGTNGGNKHGNGFINVTGAGGAYVPAGITKHTAGVYSATGCSAACHMGVGGTANPVWGSLLLTCVDCHNAVIVRTKGRPGSTLAAVKAEFGLAWGHKKSGRTAVSAADCIVCHLEGKYTGAVGSAVTTTKYHADGNIDLRDPAGVGEAPITDLNNAAWTFQRFSTSYAAGSRTSAAANSIDNIITRKFCLACHDANGATNTTARSNNGGTGTAAMPFGGILLGANYTAANGAIGTQGLINVFSQFSSNSSYHPVRKPLNRDFPTAARMNDPYKPTGTRGTSGTLSNSAVINCFDCHNQPGTPLTLRTVAAHGASTTNYLRGTPTVPNGAAQAAAGTNESTLCKVCHYQYDTSTPATHGTGSAFSSQANSGMDTTMRYGCNMCHSSGYDTAVVRPVRGMDVHGVNVLPTATVTLSGRWSTGADKRPYAFIRNATFLGDHEPLKAGATTYSPQCNMAGSSGGGGACSNQGAKTYTAGGTY